jgi:hypothetical protein
MEPLLVAGLIGAAVVALVLVLARGRASRASGWPWDGSPG